MNQKTEALDQYTGMMLRAHQTPGKFGLKKLSHLIFADAFFSKRTFYEGIHRHGVGGVASQGAEDEATEENRFRARLRLSSHHNL